TVSQGQQRVTGSRQDLNPVSSQTVRGSNILERGFPLSLLGMNLCPQGVNRGFRPRESQGSIERVNRLTVLTHAIERAGIGQLGGEIAGILLQGCPVLGGGVRKLHLLPEGFRPRQMQRPRGSQRPLGSFQLFERRSSPV